MTNQEEPRHLEIKDETDRTVAKADVTTALGPEGTVRTSMQSDADAPRGYRASLVDAVMDLPEVQASTRLEATVPLGDGEALERLRQRTEDAVTRPAGSTALLDANIPLARPPEADPERPGDITEA